ncbi:unnamed protein product [Prunus armeniaca]
MACTYYHLFFESISSNAGWARAGGRGGWGFLAFPAAKGSPGRRWGPAAWASPRWGSARVLARRLS